MLESPHGCTMSTLFRVAKGFLKQVFDSSTIYGMQDNSSSNK